MSRFRAVLLMASIVAVAVSWIVWRTNEQPVPHAASQSSDAVGVSHRSAGVAAESVMPVPLAAAGASIALPPNEAQPIQAMRARFEVADNYRAFIEKAMAEPAAGGRTYALLAYYRCLPLNYQTLEHQPDDSPAIKLAKQQLKREIDRCDGVLATFGSDATFFRRVMDARGGVDPLLPVNGRGLITAATAGTAHQDFAAARSTGDPYLSAVVMEANVDYLLPGWLGPHYDATQAQTYFAAARVVACELGGYCASPLLNAERCAHLGLCENADYSDYVLATISTADRPSYLLAVAKLRQAVSTR